MIGNEVKNTLPQSEMGMEKNGIATDMALLIITLCRNPLKAEHRHP
jgi:hypothetical protein